MAAKATFVDGYDAAEFTRKIKALLEQPATLFTE
jgi:pyruvate/2-oxoglutarate dehydrogenase complex dihydrolipoamide acyltransferase (E2) component